MTRTEDEDIVADQLTVVLVRCEHVGLDAGGSSLGGERADYVVRLEAVCLQHGNVHGSNDILDDGYGGADVLRRLLALRLIGRKASSRNVLPWSNATPICVGCSLVRISFRVFTNPMTAEVFIPLELIRGFFMNA